LSTGGYFKKKTGYLIRVSNYDIITNEFNIYNELKIYVDSSEGGKLCASSQEVK